MPIVRTPVETWVCFICGRTATVTLDPADALEHFMTTLHWQPVSDNEVACDRCAKTPDVFHLLLAQRRAQTT